jgi:23S rRNA (uracil1939-C5)-methyltransferase
VAKIERLHGLSRGQRIRLDIESLAPGGDGVGHHDGLAVFVSRVAPGDTVEVELFDVRKSFARGNVVEIIKPSDVRVEPRCYYFDRCGGCQWQHIDYDAQIRAKQEIVEQAVRHIEGVKVEPALAAPSAFDYRNKAQFPVKQSKRGKLRVGYFEHSSHQIVDIDECVVQPETMDLVLREMKYLVAEHHISAYTEETHEGLLRHICARQSFHNQEILVTLVVNLENQAALKEARIKKTFDTVAKELMEQIKEVKGVCLNFNASRGNKIFGDRTIPLQGVSEIEEVLQSKREDRPTLLTDGIKFRMSSQSFFQINTEQAVNLFDDVYDQVAAIKERLGKPLRILDVYAGVGAIAMWVSPLAENIVAVEEYEDAVQDGVATVENNKVDIITFEEGRAEDVLERMASENFEADVVILDPPRKGASPEVLSALMKLAPRYVIYVSCNPQTLGRDLKILQDGVLSEGDGKQVYTGYKTQRVKPVDLFPQTYHVESVSTLERFVDDGAVGNLEKI